MPADRLALLGLLLCGACASQPSPPPEDSSGCSRCVPSRPGDGGSDDAGVGGAAGVGGGGAAGVGGGGAAGVAGQASSTMRITVGATGFSAQLCDSESAKAFAGLLPVTFTMADLNANEKHVSLPDDLPAQPTHPGTIQAGDVMLYGSSTLVLFYRSFPTSYSYTCLARVDDPAGLAAALGTGDVAVTFAR